MDVGLGVDNFQHETFQRSESGGHYPENEKSKVTSTREQNQRRGSPVYSWSINNIMGNLGQRILKGRSTLGSFTTPEFLLSMASRFETQFHGIFKVVSIWPKISAYMGYLENNWIVKI